MAINYEITKVDYVGNGAIQTYTFPFKILKAEDLLIYVKDDEGAISLLSLGADYSVSFARNVHGGSVTLTANLPIDHKLTIFFDPTFYQDATFKGQGTYYPETHENAFDRLAQYAQSLKERLKKAIQFQLSDSIDPVLPSPAPESVPIVKADGTGFEWISRGAFKGDPGDMGPAGEIISTVVTSELEYDDPTPMSIVNVGSFSQAALEFVLRKGPPGPPGESTVLWTSLPSLPDNGVGADGDIWLDTGSSPIGKGDLYQKESGTYVLKTNIVGPAGGLNSLDTEQGDILFDFSGLYSARFGKIISATTLRDSIRDIYDIQYVSPSVVLTSSAGTGTRERGNALTAMTLNAAVVRRSNDIAQLEFRQGGVSLDVQTSGPAIPGGGNQSFNWTGNITDTTTFSAIATDVAGGGGPTTGTGSVTINFVFPRYSGVGAPGLNAAAIVSLTKTVAVPNAAQRVDYTLAIGEVPYFAYPVTYGALAQITDENGFDATTSFTRTTRNLTNSFGVTVSCYVYEFNNPAGAANSTFYTFRR